MLSTLGVSQPPDDLPWLKAAVHLQLESGRCLYCLANHFATPIRDDLDTPNLRVVSLSLLTMTLRFLGRQAEGAASGRVPRPDRRRLSPARCPAPRLAERLGELTPKNAASLLVSLADALRFLGRETDAAALLEGQLGLAVADYVYPEALRPG